MWNILEDNSSAILKKSMSWGKNGGIVPDEEKLEDIAIKCNEWTLVGFSLKKALQKSILGDKTMLTQQDYYVILESY